MGSSRIAVKDRMLGRTLQVLHRLTHRVPTKPELARPVDPPQLVMVPTRHGPVRCKIFEPHPLAPLAGTAQRRPPVHLQIHGGGMVLRTVGEDDHICRYLASDVGCVVVSIDYDTAPQVTFPIAEEECFDVFLWTRNHAEDLGWDSSRVSVGGGSAGGKLAINVVQQAHDVGIRLQAAVLSYAIVDLSRTDRTSSIPKPLISPAIQRLVSRLYFIDASTRKHVLASPCYDRDLARKMPCVLIQTAEFDTLAPEMIVLADRLSAEGVDVDSTSYPTDHAFTVNRKNEHLEPAVREIGAFLLDALSR